MGTNSATGFGSHNARMSFAHAPNMTHPPQNQSQHEYVADQSGMRHVSTTQRRIRDVWCHNLEEEMALVRDMITRYPYVAMVSVAESHYIDSSRLTISLYRTLSFLV